MQQCIFSNINNMTKFAYRWWQKKIFLAFSILMSSYFAMSSSQMHGRQQGKTGCQHYLLLRFPRSSNHMLTGPGMRLTRKWYSIIVWRGPANGWNAHLANWPIGMENIAWTYKDSKNNNCTKCINNKKLQCYNYINYIILYN